MKKVLFSVLVVLVLLWNCGVGRGADKENRQAKGVQEKAGGRQFDAYERRGQAKGKRMRGRKQLRKKERKEIRETRRKGKEKFKAEEGKDIRQQLKALQTQIVHEKAKHLRRLAWTKRIRELAVEEKNEDIIKRANNLWQKEQLRYSHKQDTLRMHRRILMRGGGRRARPRQERSLRKKGPRDVKKHAYRGKYKAKDKNKNKGKVKETSGKETSI